MKEFIVGVDIGGTFTDCVVIDDAGTVTTAKSPSTPANFSDGMIDAIELAGKKLGLASKDFFSQITLLAHGTTTGTNAVIQRKGAKVGLITTRGHNDVIHIMRGSRGVNSHDVRSIVHFPDGGKPDPIVPKHLIEGVSERVDCFGAVVVPLNEEEVEAAIRRLVAQGVDAIAVCFLWSFLQPAHERRVRDLVTQISPTTFVTCSADLVPKWGEYERTTAVVINAYLGPLVSGYLRKLDERLKQLGYRHPLQITQCGGGTVSVDLAMASPILTLDSGPVSGVIGSQLLGRTMNLPNIITTDMGGTSFDVGIIANGRSLYSSVSTVNQYEFFIPKVDIQAIGSGGGSLVRVDDATRSIRVGPDSAGATPGPVCYDRGGTLPTVTDASVVLGYLSPDNFAGGRIRLNKAKAEAAIQVVADKLGMSLMECASGITKIVEFRMADIIRKTTVGKGLDPRDFVLFAFGGAGPAHAGVFARELGVQKIIIPQRETASTWCAFGAISADVLHVHERVDIMSSPLPAGRVNQNFAELMKAAREKLLKDGLPESKHQFQLSLDMRHRGQINEVEVAVDWQQAQSDFEPELRQQFYRRYEQLYGRGSSFSGARIEIVTFRVRASAELRRPRLRKIDNLTEHAPREALRETRPVYWEELKASVPTQVYDGLQCNPGNRLSGPCIVETPDTTVVVRPTQSLAVDAFGNFELFVR